MSTLGRARRELAYSALGSLAGLAGFVVVMLVLAPGVLAALSVVGTAAGLPLLVVAMRLARRAGAVHRRLLRRFLGCQVTPPPPFEPGTGVGILGRLDRRLRYRPGWRAVWYTIAKVPVAAVQGYAIVVTAIGAFDLAFPLLWLMFGHGAGGHFWHAPLPWGALAVSGFPAAVLAGLAGAVVLAAGYALARLVNAGDRLMITALLGVSRMDQRVSELERTRALAVDDAAAVLRRVERDLHDGAQMRLAALAMNLGMAQEKAGDDVVRDLIGAAQQNAAEALADLRHLARGIHPPVLDAGLAEAVESLAASSAIPVAVTARLAARPAPAIETIAYFCAAELMTNATKHSYANQITIDMSAERSGVLRLRVRDDGVGGADAARGTGLAGLAQRVSTVDGSLAVASPRGGPTVVTVELPMTAGGG